MLMREADARIVPFHAADLQLETCGVDLSEQVAALGAGRTERFFDPFQYSCPSTENCRISGPNGVPGYGDYGIR